ncbi:MAG: zinc ribbon domain-containing protein [Christensenellales bacterium]|jgi:hypothetical protein
MEHQKFCQSCAMPMTDEFYATEKDGSKSPDYCQYCYSDGEFTAQMSMQEMLEFCIAPMVQHNPGLTEDEARSIMAEALPTLKRWKKD